LELTQLSEIRFELKLEEFRKTEIELKLEWELRGHKSKRL